MIFEILKRALIGAGFAGILTVIFLTYMVNASVDAEVSEIWLNMLGSVLMGVYFGCSSIIFDKEGWSPLRQLSIHFVLSGLVLFSVGSLITGWIPLETKAIAISLLIFIVSYMVFMVSTYTYLKLQTKAMNDSIQKK